MLLLLVRTFFTMGGGDGEFTEFTVMLMIMIAFI